jgi:peptidoglycan hydrolase-like protein with peptidoglycan-binding domain
MAEESKGFLGDLFGKKDKDEKDTPTDAEKAKQEHADFVKRDREERETAAKTAAAKAAREKKADDANAKKAALPNLTVDGQWGASTTAAVQKALGQPATGEAWINNSDATVLQQKLGVTADGLFGKGSNTALQTYLGVTADGVFGPNSVKALQERLNAGTFFA